MGVDVASESAAVDALSVAPSEAASSEARSVTAADGRQQHEMSQAGADFAPLEAPEYWLQLLKERGLLMEGYVDDRRVDALDLVYLTPEEQDVTPNHQQLMLEEDAEVLGVQRSQHQPEDPRVEQPEDLVGKTGTSGKAFVVPRWSYRVSVPTLHRLGKRLGASIWLPEAALTPETRRAANTNIEQAFTDHSPVIVAEGQANPVAKGFSLLQAACDSWTFVMDMESLQELHLVKKDEGGGDDPCLPEKPFAWKLVLASKRSKGTGESGTEEPRVGQQQQQQQHRDRCTPGWAGPGAGGLAGRFAAAHLCIF
mmetsp:Transcript_12832/g.34075  ORF Transcript_12832/g.34075 Transcript_12832/m.34075 type:complete len:311 (-) Transcript_12832:335-1267(-)